MSGLDTTPLRISDRRLVAPRRAPAPHSHTWQLRGVDYEDGATVRCFECLGCADVRFE